MMKKIYFSTMLSILFLNFFSAYAAKAKVTVLEEKQFDILGDERAGYASVSLGKNHIAFINHQGLVEVWTKSSKELTLITDVWRYISPADEVMGKWGSVSVAPKFKTFGARRSLSSFEDLKVEQVGKHNYRITGRIDYPKNKNFGWHIELIFQFKGPITHYMYKTKAIKGSDIALVPVFSIVKEGIIDEKLSRAQFEKKYKKHLMVVNHNKGEKHKYVVYDDFNNMIFNKKISRIGKKVDIYNLLKSKHIQLSPKTSPFAIYYGSSHKLMHQICRFVQPIVNKEGRVVATLEKDDVGISKGYFAIK